ncbi:hypothetical protein [Hyunsoonleella pacifica]|jgi:hypothetical protein|uniref:Uncharacterized protein n=1 Tax=Hyunsoonleella pacifica TaxID=1080224 RepID=A0A4Q9FXB2_9FLAO|nr:hypothetical protein [Hyunsoonleella pacifica]TBN19105.1 hypothetical protein EYD46_03305 [Hyunsoonleella pacifica]GGD07344.1 hypothetical protein GCM10011368_06590 [Hyunsoonleella pacifica]
MKTNYLLPHRYKILGWILFSLGILSGICLFINGYEVKYLNDTKVLAAYYHDILESEFFKVINNQILDEIIMVFILLGGLILAFTKEKIEDEFIYKLRKDSIVWGIIFNYAILLFTIIFIYEIAFYYVLVLNMFTPLIFFIIRFNFLKLKSRSNEE